jgi:hypothetical protein
MAHNYAAIADDGIALGRIPLSTISEHDTESLLANGDTNGQIDEAADGESDSDGLLNGTQRQRPRGRKWRGRIWICCLLFLGVLVFSVLFSISFLILTKRVVPEVFGQMGEWGNMTFGEKEISWLGWEEIRYMFVLYHPESPESVAPEN